MTKAENIAWQIRQSDGEKLSLRKKAISHTVPGASDRKNGAAPIDVSTLNEILFIDPETRICKAESGVTFSHLVRETLKYNLIPMCVSELKNITIGGAVSGSSIESMSYKYGGFHDTCFEYEVVTGKGEILRCTRDECPGLFEAIHCSFGTLGIITELSFHLIPAKPYVRMNYVHYNSIESFTEAIVSHYGKQDVDFMDGIIHSPGDMILCIGTMTDQAPYKNRYIKEAFYKSTFRREEDYIPVYDYFFRYDSDCHWIARNFGFENPLFRTLLGSFFLGSQNLLTIAKYLPFLVNTVRPDVVVDVVIPVRNTCAFYEWYLSTFNYFPIWVVPYRPRELYSWMNPSHFRGIKDSLCIDFAIYGFKQPKNGVNYYRILEEKVQELRGFKALITHNYYDEEDFWKIYNRPAYMDSKLKLDPDNRFDDVYAKLHRKKHVNVQAG